MVRRAMVSRAARAGAGSPSALPHPLHPYAPSMHPRCTLIAPSLHPALRPPCTLAAPSLHSLRPHCTLAAPSLHLCRRGAVRSPRASAARSCTRYRGAPSLTRTRTSTLPLPLPLPLPRPQP